MTCIMGADITWAGAPSFLAPCTQATEVADMFRMSLPSQCSDQPPQKASHQFLMN